MVCCVEQVAATREGVVVETGEGAEVERGFIHRLDHMLVDYNLPRDLILMDPVILCRRRQYNDQ